MQGCKAYLDNAATTPMTEEARAAAARFEREAFFNPSATYGEAQHVRWALEEAKDGLAALLGCEAREIYATSGGTESDNWALAGAVEEALAAGETPHLIVSEIEHHAVLAAAERLERLGAEVDYVAVDAEGRVDPEAVRALMKPNTRLVSVMTANNEIGTVMDIAAIARVAHEGGALMHTDAVQAFAHIPLDVRELGVDLLSVSAHKFGGPKGVGFLYVKRRTPLERFHVGGGQERGMRAGTENVAGIVAMATAARQACDALTAGGAERLAEKRDRFVRALEERVGGVAVNGVPIEEGFVDGVWHRMPGNANVKFDGVRADALLFHLGINGVYASGASACSAGAAEPSFVLRAIGLSDEEALSSVRFSLGEHTTDEELDYALDQIERAVRELRSLDA
jgi:cysteine desulfurase